MRSLENAGIAKVTANYNGQGDEGYVEEVTCYDIHGNHSNCDFEDDIKDFIYNCLEQHRGGWEINDGSHGDCEIDAVHKTIKFDHYDHIMKEESNPFEE